MAVPTMTTGRVGAVSSQLARRSFTGTMRVPGTIIPIIVMPIFFVVAFSGAFGALATGGIIPTDNILNWQVPFAVLQGASFAGLGAAFGAGRDLETGFYDRLLLAPTRRIAFVLGPLSFSMVRGLLPLVTVVPLGIIGGARLSGGFVGLMLLVLATLGIALIAGLWGLGVIYRFKTQRAAALVQTGIFVTLFLSVGQVPLSAMEGTWLYPVARLNPFTRILTMARESFMGLSWDDTWPGLVALLVMSVLFSLFAWRGFTKLER